MIAELTEEDIKFSYMRAHSIKQVMDRCCIPLKHQQKAFN